MLIALGRLLLGLPKRLELRPREQIRVASDDLGPLGDLLLADAHGAPFLGALEEVALEARLVVGRTEDCSDAQGRANLSDGRDRAAPVSLRPPRAFIVHK